MGSDFRFAARALRRSPRNTAIAIAIVALGIGINTAMFSGINQVLLRPLPFHDADRVMRLRDVLTDVNGQRHPFNMSSRTFTIVRDASDVFEAMVALSGENMTMTGTDLPSRLSVVRQTAGADRVLGILPVIGREFTAEEERRGEQSGVALVSHALWQTKLGGTTAVLGSRIQLDDRAFTVVGIMPPNYAFPYQAQVWIPHAADPADASRDFAVFGRLKPGVTGRQMLDALDHAAARARETQTTSGRYGIEVMTLRDNLVGSQDAPLRALTAIVTFLLLIASVNVATLLLAGAVSRRREFAIRAALGASRARHVRQLLAESLIVAAVGCAGGVWLAAWMAPFTSRLMPTVFGEELGLFEPQTDWRVAAFAAAAAAVTAIVAAVMPAAGTWRTDPQTALLEQTRSSTTARSGRRLLSALIVAQTAFTMVLLVGAGLVIRNFARLQAEDLGFNPARLLTMELVPPMARYPAGPGRAQLVAAVVDAVAVQPGVVFAAATTVNPLGGGTWGMAVITDEAEARDPAAASNVNHRVISPGLFRAMGIPLLRGRDFTVDDRADSPRVVIVSDRMARHLWPSQDPIGRRVRIARPGLPWLTVVGIAGDVSDSHFPGVPFETWYVPFAQNAATPAAEHVYLMIRTGGDALALVPTVRRAIAGVDGTLAPYKAAAMDAYFADTIVRERVSAWFMLGFGGFGLGLAALGVYGVMAFTIRRRTVELGIRMALGATVRDVLAMVLKGSGGLVAGGVAAGACAAVGLNRILARMLPEIGILDPQVIGVAALLIVVCAVAACLLPAWTASRIDPVASLRTE